MLPVLPGLFLFNLFRNIVALQVERVVARITTARSTCLVTNFGVASCSNMLHKVEPSSTFCNNFFQLATPKFVARQVKRAVVLRATTCSTCNATMLRNKLKKNVARITGRMRILTAHVIHVAMSRHVMHESAR